MKSEKLKANSKKRILESLKLNEESGESKAKSRKLNTKSEKQKDESLRRKARLPALFLLDFLF